MTPGPRRGQNDRSTLRSPAVWRSTAPPAYWSQQLSGTFQSSSQHWYECRHSSPGDAMRNSRFMSVGLTIAALLAIVGSTASAQTRVITGQVRDSLSNDPVTSGEVSVQGSTITTTIKDDGTFTLAVPSRDVTLNVRSI